MPVIHFSIFSTEIQACKIFLLRSGKLQNLLALLPYQLIFKVSYVNYVFFGKHGTQLKPEKRDNYCSVSSFQATKILARALTKEDLSKQFKNDW